MKRISSVIFFLLLVGVAAAQTKNFELLNPDAIDLSKEQLTSITTRNWKVNRVETQIRDETVQTEGWAFLEFEQDHQFKYGGKKGGWELVDGKFIRYTLKNQEDEARFNFGGIYAVIGLSDSTLTLTKVLTSTHDMKRTMHLISSDAYYRKRAEKVEFYYRGDISKKALDSISSLSEETLLKAGYFFGVLLLGDTIQIHTPENIYKIKKNTP